MGAHIATLTQPKHNLFIIMDVHTHTHVASTMLSVCDTLDEHRECKNHWHRPNQRAGGGLAHLLTGSSRTQGNSRTTSQHQSIYSIV